MTVYYKDYNLLRCRAQRLSLCARQCSRKGREGRGDQKKTKKKTKNYNYTHTTHSRRKLHTYCRKRKLERKNHRKPRGTSAPGRDSQPISRQLRGGTEVKSMVSLLTKLRFHLSSNPSGLLTNGDEAQTTPSVARLI